MDAPRSMLFVSGEKPDRFAKALASGADLVCIDLEDAVHPGAKAQAREAAFAFAAGRPAGAGVPLAIRLNGLRTREGLADIAALVASGARLDALLLPKVEEPADLSLVHAWAADAFDALVALVETPIAIERAADLAATARQGAPKLAALMLGGADLSVELGAAFGWDGLLAARGRLVNAARTTGLQVWDVPHLDLGDLPGLTLETRAVLRLGFTCKSAIHPTQVAAIHAAFVPDEAEVRWARGLLQAHAGMERALDARGAFLYEGKMVDPPVLAKARRIARLAEAAARAAD
jgi:citrate lyase beta subunit